MHWRGSAGAARHAEVLSLLGAAVDVQGAIDYLRQMYGPARYTVLDDVRKLPLTTAVFDRATPDATVHMSELELVRVAPDGGQR